MALLLQVGCGSPQSKEATAADERQAASSPEEIQALFTREKDLPEAREAQGPGAAWTAKFPSDTPVTITRGEGHALAEFSLGTEAKVRCAFYDELIEAGRTISVVLDGFRQKATLDSVLPYRVDGVAGSPVVFLEARYTVAGENGKQAGSVKLAVSPRLHTPVFCFLDEPGYVQTFTSAVGKILETLTVKEAQAEAIYAEIWLTSAGGVPFGFDWLEVIDAGEGQRSTINLSSSFMPAGPGELALSDEVEVIKSDSSGVLEGTYSETEDGELGHELTLTRTGKSKYTVKGQVQGKDFEQKFDAQKLPDTVAVYRLLSQNHKKTTQLTVSEYMPSLDPSGPGKVSYAIDGKARTVAIQMGQMSLQGTLNDEGLVQQVTASVGGHEIKQEVIFRAGKF